MCRVTRDSFHARLDHDGGDDDDDDDVGNDGDDDDDEEEYKGLVPG